MHINTCSFDTHISGQSYASDIFRPQSPTAEAPWFLVSVSYPYKLRLVMCRLS